MGTQCRRFLPFVAVLGMSMNFTGCSSVSSTTGAVPAPSQDGVAALLAPWPGSFGGVPPFARFVPAALRPALEEAMAAGLREIDRIANEPAPPTFQNTIEALEGAGRALDRAGTVLGIYSNSLNDEVVEAIDREMAPKLAAYSDRIVQNRRLYERIAAVYEARERSGLTPEQQRLVWLRYTGFVRAGARLAAPAKARLSATNQRLAELTTRFSQNVLAEDARQMPRPHAEPTLA